MNLQDKTQVTSENSSFLNKIIVEGIQDVKGKSVLKMDLRNLEDAPADYFIICQGESTTQVEAIARSIMKKCKEELSEVPNKTEGMRLGKWVIVDYFDTVVHIFHPDSRKFYSLESLWNDAEFEEYQDID